MLQIVCPISFSLSLTVEGRYLTSRRQAKAYRTIQAEAYRTLNFDYKD